MIAGGRVCFSLIMYSFSRLSKVGLISYGLGLSCLSSESFSLRILHKYQVGIVNDCNIYAVVGIIFFLESFTN